MIPYGKQDISEEDIKEVANVLRSEFLTQGSKVNEFEEKFSSYIGSRFSVAVSNGTAALHLSAKALGVRPGLKTITSPITFAASANCVLYCGGDVEFADIDPKTYCLDPNRVEEVLKKNPKAYQGIIPVDYAGFPVQMDDFKTLADKYNIWLLEDACHAPGASFYDRTGQIQRSGNGNLSQLAVFSFHPVKHIASGEGGMITTNDEKLYKKLKLLRTHGITKNPLEYKNKADGAWYYEMQELGYNYRIPDVLCALGLSQLNRVDVSFRRRQEIAARYAKELCDLPITLPYIEKNATHAFHLYVIRTSRRNELFNYLRNHSIFAQVHYVPVHQMPFYQEKYGKQHFACAEQFYNECLSIPIYHSMTEVEQSTVIQVVRDFFNHKL